MDNATDLDLESAGVADVGAALTDGLTSSVELVHGYLARIRDYDRQGPAIHAIRMLAPDAEEQAAALDRERATGNVRGPLHGVPVLVKDNIDVAGWPTTAGALALQHSTPDRDAGLVGALRAAGAVILGKTNLTELANFMTEGMPSGYSSLGGQVLNPYDVSISPCGSSSGSGAAAAMAFATVTVGTETDGSITCPAGAQSLVGLKPTVGLVSGDGIVPVATSQDCAGPMTRTVADAAALLGALTGQDVELRPDALAGARLAAPPCPDDLHPDERELFLAALETMRGQGAQVVDVPALAETNELPLLVHEFARDMDAYLARLPVGAPMRTLADIARWNDEHATQALKFGQTLVRAALEVDHDAQHAAYVAGRARDVAVAAEHGIDAAVAAHRVAAIVTPSWRSAGVSARAGYPSLAVPAGYRSSDRRPFGITLLGPSRSEATLLSLGLHFERAAAARRPVSQVNPSLLRS